jgi:hypothetical protein
MYSTARLGTERVLHTVNLDVNGFDGELEAFQLLSVRLFLARFEKVLQGEDLGLRPETLDELVKLRARVIGPHRTATFLLHECSLYAAPAAARA